MTANATAAELTAAEARLDQIEAAADATQRIGDLLTAVARDVETGTRLEPWTWARIALIAAQAAQTIDPATRVGVTIGFRP